MLCGVHYPWYWVRAFRLLWAGSGQLPRLCRQWGGLLLSLFFGPLFTASICWRSVTVSAFCGTWGLIGARFSCGSFGRIFAAVDECCSGTRTLRQGTCS